MTPLEPGHVPGAATLHPAPAEGCLLSPDESIRRASSMRSWRTADREQLRGMAAAAFAGWREAWVGTASAGSPEATRCRNPQEVGGALTEAAWRPWGEMGWAWWAVAGRGQGSDRAVPGLDELFRALVGEASAAPLAGRGEAQASVAEDLVRAAWRDLERRLGGLVPPRPPTADPARPPAFSPWSGALLLTFPWWDAELWLLLDGAAVEHRLAPTRRAPAPAGGLVPVWRALSRRPASIQVLAGSFELDLGTLASLRPGDVIRIPQALDQPLDVLAVGAPDQPPTPIGAAFLGRVGDRRAVELVRRSPAEPGRQSQHR